MKLTLKVQASICDSQSKVNALVNRCVAHGIDEIVYSIGSGIVYCKSDLIDPAVDVEQFDPLAALIMASFSVGIKVHAWMSWGIIPKYWTEKLSSVYPEWDVATLGNPFPADFHFLDWRQPTVAPFTAAFASEILGNYSGLSGLTYDYFRYGFWSGNPYEVWDLYGVDCQSYVQAAAAQTMNAITAAGPQYTFSLHGFADYYGLYMGQSWDKLLDAGVFHLVYPMAYYDSSHTFGVSTPDTLEWAIASWAEKYRPKLVPVISSLNFDGGEVLKAPADFAAQVGLCSAFPRIGIFDQRVSDAQLSTIASSPEAPSSLSATSVSRTRIDLAWVDNSNNETGFKIERSLNGTSWAQIATVGAGITSYNDTGLTCGTTYYYRVCAYN